MAYKFQTGAAILSGSLTQEGSLAINNDAGVQTGVFDNDGAISGSGACTFTSISSTTSVTAGSSFIIGNADLNETDLEKLDGITNGAGLANKALVLGAGSNVASGLVQLTASAGIKAQKLESVGKTIVGTDLTVGALFKMPTVTSGFILVADGTSYQEVELTGDAAIASNGALTLASNSVSNAQLDNDAVTGAELADDAVDSEHYTDASVDFAHLQNVAANSLLIRNANSSGVLSELALTTTQIMIGDGTGMVAAALSGDVTMTNGGVTTIGSAKILDPMIHDNVATGLAGAGLAANAGVLSVQGNAVTVATDTVILSEGYNYFTGSAIAVCTMPSGTLGDVVTVKAGPTAAGKTITISRSGSADTIDGGTTVVLESPYAAVTMVYMTHGDWRIV